MRVATTVPASRISTWRMVPSASAALAVSTRLAGAAGKLGWLALRLTVGGWLGPPPTVKGALVATLS